MEKGDSLKFSFIAESAADLKDENKPFQGKYVAAIIKTLANSNGNARVGDMWKASGMSWDMFMDSDKVDAFVANNVSP